MQYYQIIAYLHSSPYLRVRAVIDQVLSLVIAFGILGWSALQAENLVADWNEAFTVCITKDSPPPALAARNLAMLHLAIYQADQTASKVKLSLEERELAISSAAYAVSSYCFPSYRSILHQKMSQHLSQLKGGDGSQSSQAIKIGKDAASSILNNRKNDGASTSTHYIPANKPGSWHRTGSSNRPPELPHWGNVHPFVLDSIEKFLPPPPPALNTPAYAEEWAEVRRMGGQKSRFRTKEQTLIARFWSDFSYTGTPPGHWNEITRNLSRSKKLSPEASAKLFMLLNVSMADAGIVVWKAKYQYDFWRPSTAITKADSDGNSMTKPDGDWKSLLPSPPHPEYVSGHAGFSGAAAETLAQFFGDDKMSFVTTSETVPNVERHYDSFQACAQEIVMSRVYGGIHYPVSGTEGITCGRRVAAKVCSYYNLSPQKP